MKFCRTAVLVGLFLASQLAPLMAETVRLKSGSEVQIVDGQVPEKIAEDIFREAEELLKKGRLDLAGDYWQLIVDKARGGIVSRARAAQERVREIEYGSFVVLRSGKLFKGKVRAHLRADLLGLEGKEEIPLWQVEEIVAEYHPGYSPVSKSYYPLTILEIKLRGGELKTSRITGEIEFLIESAGAPVTQALLGKNYELLRPADLGGQLEAMSANRIAKVVIYPDLRRPE